MISNDLKIGMVIFKTSVSMEWQNILDQVSVNFFVGSPNPDLLPDAPSGIIGKTNLEKIAEGAVSFNGHQTAAGDAIIYLLLIVQISKWVLVTLL